MARKPKALSSGMTNTPPLPATNTITLALNFDPVAAQVSLNAAEVEAKEAEQIEIHTDSELQVVAEYLRETVIALDAVEALQKSCADPIYKAWKSTREIFAPEIEWRKATRRYCDAAIGRYRLRQIEAQRAALALATASMSAGQAPPVAAIQAANTAPTKAEGVAVKAHWVAEVIAPDLLLPEYQLTIPNQPKIDAHAARYAEHETPSAIPGVRFTLVAGGTRVSR